MRLNIKYDIEKDIVNFQNSRKAINRKTNTKAEETFISGYGDFTRENLLEFLKEFSSANKIDLDQIATDIGRKWEGVEHMYISRCEKLFGVSIPVEEFTAYVTLNGRCTYNIQDGYFFVSYKNERAVSTIMHELFHFYTWEAFGKELSDTGCDKQKYNDIKESLTVLLNVEFTDLMNGEVDKGYSQHEAMRKRIVRHWSKKKSLPVILEKLMS